MSAAVDDPLIERMRKSNDPATKCELISVVDAFTAEIKGWRIALDARLKAMTERVAELERENADLKARRVMCFAGGYDPAIAYAPGSVVQRSNGQWCAMVATSEPPGASAHWRKIG